VRLYRLRREPFLGLDAWLEEVRAFWQFELDSFRSYTDEAQPE
jgi:hypothetical protein